MCANSNLGHTNDSSPIRGRLRCGDGGGRGRLFTALPSWTVRHLCLCFLSCIPNCARFLIVKPKFDLHVVPSISVVTCWASCASRSRYEVGDIGTRTMMSLLIVHFSFVPAGRCFRFIG